MLFATAHGVDVRLAEWRDTAVAVGACDALIVDPPFSARTHAGHGAAIGPNMKYDIAYTPWDAAEVAAFVATWSARTRGWFVVITDHVLAPAWDRALAAARRYVFAPFPYVAPGSRVRVAGDGPACWAAWIIAARPRSSSFLSWGALPGAYVLPHGHGGHLPIVGGKPLWLLEQLVEDYSRPGDLVCDPCCGSGVLAVAAIRKGRRAVVGDVSRGCVEAAVAWVKNPSRVWPAMRAHGHQGDLFDLPPLDLADDK